MPQDDLPTRTQMYLKIMDTKDPSHQQEGLDMNGPPLPINLSTLPPEIIFCVMSSLGPREIIILTRVNSRIRLLSAAQLSHAYDIRIRSRFSQLKPGNIDISNDTGSALDSAEQLAPMSEYELYVRLVLSDLYLQEAADVSPTTGMDEVRLALSCCKRILRRLYLMNRERENFLDDPYGHISNHRNAVLPFLLENPDSSLTIAADHHPTSPILSPYISSTENLHIMARILADQVCRGICLPETAVLILQTLTSLWDQDQFQYLVNSPEKHPTLRVPAPEDRLSMGHLCFQYLIPNILALLQPVLQPPSSSRSMGERQHGEQLSEDQGSEVPLHPPSPQLQIHPQLMPPPHRSTTTNNSRLRSFFDRTKSLTSSVLHAQQELLLQPRIRSIAHLTRVLVFLPLLGRHFNALPTSTFIETFLDRSKGDLPIDRAAVMVYGFMCVLDLETGKANLTSDSYKIFERSMPTQGAVQAQEIVRIVSRYRLLMRGFLLSSPTFSSTRMFGQNNSS
ncbi:hypothetical protein BGX33_005155 [Mortierella sp. NVP41]|nr:hypothetical protein BGX33_005155 [Mortierella sp. NVP41]